MIVTRYRPDSDSVPRPTWRVTPTALPPMDDFEIVDSPQDVDLDWELLDDAHDDDEHVTAACEESPNGADHRSSPAVDAEDEQPLTPPVAEDAPAADETPEESDPDEDTDDEAVLEAVEAVLAAVTATDDETVGGTTIAAELPSEHVATEEKPCADDLEARYLYEKQCVRNVRALQTTKETNSDINAKARAALDEWTPKAKRAYDDAADAAAEAAEKAAEVAAVCCSFCKEKAELAADKFQELLLDPDIGWARIEPPAVTVIAPAVLIAALLVACVSWLAVVGGFRGGAAVHEHHQSTHMQQLTLIEKEMARLEAFNYRPIPVEIVQPYEQPKKAKKTKKSRHNKTRASFKSLMADPTIHPEILELIVPIPTPLINITVEPTRSPQQRVSKRAARHRARRTVNATTLPVVDVNTQPLRVKGWASMDERSNSANAAPLIVAEIYNAVGGWPSMVHHYPRLALRPSARHRHELEHIIVSPTLKRTNRSIELSIAISTATTITSSGNDMPIGCYSYTNIDNNTLVLSTFASASHLVTNSSLPAVGDGTLWPTIPLPPSPTIHAPIRMPPIAMAMPPIQAAISLPPVVITVTTQAIPPQCFPWVLLTDCLNRRCPRPTQSALLSPYRRRPTIAAATQ